MKHVARWVICALCAGGCAGQLTPEEIEAIVVARNEVVGAGGAGSTTTTSSTTGMGGSGGTDPAACVLPLASGPKCAAGRRGGGLPGLMDELATAFAPTD